MVRTVDTDVVVLAMTFFSQLGAEKMWIAFWTGKHFCNIDVHNIVKALGPEESKTPHVLMPLPDVIKLQLWWLRQKYSLGIMDDI